MSFTGDCKICGTHTKVSGRIPECDACRAGNFGDNNARCNQCGHGFETFCEDFARISCPKCKSNTSLSIYT